MTSLLLGIGLLSASGVVLYPFIPAKGVEPNRNEWIDIVVAITVSAGLAGGMALIVIGVTSFFT